MMAKPGSLTQPSAILTKAQSDYVVSGGFRFWDTAASGQMTVGIPQGAPTSASMMRHEQPAFFRNRDDRQRGQRADEKPGGEGQQRSVVVLADDGADADAEQRRDRAVQR